jgi:glycogen debranching enzyme
MADRGMTPWRTLITVVHPHPSVKVNHGATFLVTDQQGAIPAGSEGEYGLYSADTRFLSRHELRLNGRRPESVASVRLSFRHARWHMVADSIAGPGGDMREARVAVTVDRLISLHQMHEDLTLHTYGRAPVTVLLEIALESDFADLFEVRYRSWQRRADLNTWWVGPASLESRYQNQDFVRRCLVRAITRSSGLTYANGALRIPVDLVPGEQWKVCLQYDLLTSDNDMPQLRDACAFAPGAEDPLRLARGWQRSVSRVDPADVRLQFAYERAIEDFAALRLHEQESSGRARAGRAPDEERWMPAAGLPWFMALFGRDSIIASMQAMVAQPAVAMGTLENLARWQSEVDDPERDAEPGKMPHELRVGEWAHFGLVPHRPYYGTADATPLYLLLLAESFRWTGDVAGLSVFRRTAEQCLEWVDMYGDRDGDGFQEYAPRTPRGYRNQAWRDAHDGVVDESGAFPELPIATSEMQAYVYGAKLRIAPLFEAWGDHTRAAALRSEAAELRRRFIEAFWLDDVDELAFVLDGRKRAVRTVVSNSGHCLWMGILDEQRGRAAARRLLQPDLFTGWGLRVLSDRHPSYDPHSYQRGSVWPHDSVIAAAGMRRYGMAEEAWTVLDGLLAAVMCFEDVQMPELFAGLPKSEIAVPVPYRMANVPQAWAAGSVLHMVRILLGLEPDLPEGRVYLDPALPAWCSRLEVGRLRMGRHDVRVRVERRPDGEHIVEADTEGLELVRGVPPWLEIAAD